MCSSDLSEYVERCENVIALGNSGTGKSHIALGLGLAACQHGLSVGFAAAAALVHELLEARDDKRLLRIQRQLASYKLLIIDELGYVPLSQTGAELLFEVFSQRYERSSTIVTSNLPFEEWTQVFGSERLTGALLDRLIRAETRHVLEIGAAGDVTAAGAWSWRFAHDTREGPLERTARCRLDARPARRLHSRVTLYFGRTHPEHHCERVRPGDWLWQFRPRGARAALTSPRDPGRSTPQG